MRFLLALTVALGMLVLTPSPSWACSCAAMTPQERIASAGTVATGTVDWTSTDGQTRTYKVDFDAVYKGAAATSEKLRTNDNAVSCGLANLAIDERYVFFIEGKHPGAMRLNACLGAVAYADAIADQVEAVTGPPDKPLRAPTAYAPPEDGNGAVWALAGGGVLVVLVATALTLRRRGGSAR